MIEVTLRNMPREGELTNHTSNHTRSFSSLETAMREVRKMDTILVAIEEKGVGFHKAPLTKDGATALSPYNYRIPTGGKMHYSEKFKEIEKMLDDESKKPKLA